MISHTASSGLSLSAAITHRRERADRRADVRDQLREAEPRAERDRVRLALGEDPERAEHVQHQPGARAHDQAEQELAAHVAEQRRLDAGREVVVRRPVAGRHDGARDRADPVAVDQHVDRQDDDQDQREAGLDERCTSASRVKPTTSPAPPVIRSPIVCSARLALLLDLDVDRRAGRASPAGRRARRSRRRRSPGRRAGGSTPGRRSGCASRNPSPARNATTPTITIADRRAARDLAPAAAATRAGSGTARSARR